MKTNQVMVIRIDEGYPEEFIIEPEGNSVAVLKFVEEMIKVHGRTPDMLDAEVQLNEAKGTGIVPFTELPIGGNSVIYIRRTANKFFALTEKLAAGSGDSQEGIYICRASDEFNAKCMWAEKYCDTEDEIEELANSSGPSVETNDGNMFILEFVKKISEHEFNILANHVSVLSTK